MATQEEDATFRNLGVLGFCSRETSLSDHLLRRACLAGRVRGGRSATSACDLSQYPGVEVQRLRDEKKACQTLHLPPTSVTEY